MNIIAVEPTLNMFSYMADAEAGDTVECIVNLKNNPGIAAVQLTPMYDDTVFELTDAVSYTHLHFSFLLFEVFYISITVLLIYVNKNYISFFHLFVQE